MMPKRVIYTETVRFLVPTGMTATLTAAAEREGTTVSEWVRRACVDRLRAAPPEPVAANCNAEPALIRPIA